MKIGCYRVVVTGSAGVCREQRQTRDDILKRFFRKRIARTRLCLRYTFLGLTFKSVEIESHTRNRWSFDGCAPYVWSYVRTTFRRRSPEEPRQYFDVRLILFVVRAKYITYNSILRVNI